MSGYQLLPFRFRRMKDAFLLVNDLGQHHFLDGESFRKFVGMVLPEGGQALLDLISKDFACSGYSAPLADAWSAKYRTRKRFLFDSTALHMFVVTQRCNQSCAYCHASSGVAAEGMPDMTPEVGRRCVELALESPAPVIKIEFQGGEPTLNFPTIQAVVAHAEKLGQGRGRSVEFVLCTNLLEMDGELLAFLQAHDVKVSTSLDGPAELHDACRVSRDGMATHRTVKRNIAIARQACGQDSVSALLTVSRSNLGRLRDVVDEYVESGFSSIFIRMLNPFGQAARSWEKLAYGVEEFIEAYLDAFDYILELNRSGVRLVEEYMAILLSRILTPFSSGFVDLQSPAGIAIGGMVYETNGDIFVSDEARMLHRATGDRRFCLGSGLTMSRAELLASAGLREALASSVIEALPGCAWCAFQPYCGGDPVRNSVLCGSFVSFKPRDSVCRKHQAIFDRLFELLRSGDEMTLDILWSWITGRDLHEIALAEA